MSDILIVNPSIDLIRQRSATFTFPWLNGGHGWFFLPGLFLASYLKKRGVNAEVLDMELYSSEEELTVLKERLKDTEFVGLSVMTAQVPHAIKIAEFIRSVSKNIKIVWGGTHVSLLPGQVFESTLSDSVISGVGEPALHSLVTGAADIPYEFEEPDYSVLDTDRYFSFQGPYRNFDILTSRGCPYKCSFCINSILKNRWILLDADRSIALIRNAHDRYKFRHTFIMDENFFGRSGRAIAIIEGIASLEITWESNAAALDIIKLSVDDLIFLRKSGCTKLRMGAESGSDRLLDILNKRTTVSQMAEARDKCLRAGIIPVMSFMVHLPDETPEDYQLTMTFIAECYNKGAQIIGPQVFRPYPGSKEYLKLVARGLQIPASLEAWATSSLFNTV